MIRPLAACLLALPVIAMAQTPAAPSDAGPAGKWEGALGNLRLVLEVTKSSDGLLIATLRSVDQGNVPIPVESARQVGDSLYLEIPVIRGRYSAKLSSDRTQLIGLFDQGTPLPLTLTRTTAIVTAAPELPAPPSPFGLMMDASVAVPPMPVMGNGKRHLIYELRLVNQAGGEVRISRIEVLGGTSTLASYEGAALNGILQQARPNVPDARAVPAGVRVTAFIQITLDSAAPIPATLRHRVTAANGILDSVNVRVSSARPIIIGPPFRGNNWLAANGPGNASGHRRAAIAINGRAAIAQRFAIDWAQTIENGSATFAGSPTDNKSYRAYGAEIVAVADGIVASTKDSIPENVPGATSRAVPITPVTIGGNYVIQDLGGGRYAFYAHLQPGSLRVKPGQRIRKGQVIGLLGNSGNSTEPHLHFQVMDGPSPLAAEGIPYVIDAWELRTPTGTWEKRMNQIPMQDQVIRVSGPPRKP